MYGEKIDGDVRERERERERIYCVCRIEPDGSNETALTRNIINSIELVLFPPAPPAEIIRTDVTTPEEP